MCKLLNRIKPVLRLKTAEGQDGELRMKRHFSKQVFWCDIRSVQTMTIAISNITNHCLLKWRQCANHNEAIHTLYFLNIHITLIWQIWDFLQDFPWFYLPHIFSGASSSRRIGWLRKSSLDLRHSPLTSDSVKFTVLPGLHPRTTKHQIQGFCYKQKNENTKNHRKLIKLQL